MSSTDPPSKPRPATTTTSTLPPGTTLPATTTTAAVVSTAPPPTTTTVPPTTTTNRSQIVFPRRNVPDVPWTPFAQVGGVTLHHPSNRVERIGFHESNNDGARPLEALPGAVGPYDQETRERGTPGRTAADVVVDPRVQIRAPATGTVIRGGTYTLYCDHKDNYLVINPDGHPGWEVKVLHIGPLRVKKGDRVQAGTTVVATRPAVLPFDSTVDEASPVQPAWPHVHIEVVDPTIPDRPGRGVLISPAYTYLSDPIGKVVDHDERGRRLAISATSAPGPYTYADLEAMPEDNVRREIINGELFVNPSPILRHQKVVMELAVRIYAYAKEHGGQVFGNPVDVFVDLKNVVAPDVLFIRAERVESMGTKNLQIPPDLVVEVSSPSTRRRDVGAKRELYERFGVGEYWFVDLDADRVEVYVLGDTGFGPGVLKHPGDYLEPARLPGFSVVVSEIFEE